MMMDDYDKQLGQRLKALREMHRMTQAEVGAHIGLSHQQIQKYETGQSQVRANLACRLASLYGVPVASILENQSIMAVHDKAFTQNPPVPMRVAESAAEDLPAATDISQDIVKLVTLFSQIPAPQQRAVVLNLAQSLAVT
jgi:transcriptional regulator with XRE-family HTH domain